MIKEALAYFLDIAGGAIPLINQTKAANGKGTVIAVKNGYTLQQMTGPVTACPAHTFRDVADFAAYLIREAVEGRADPAKASILVSEGGITADMDSYDPDASAVTCSLESAPGWAAWRNAFGRPMDIDGLYAFIRAYDYTIAPVLVKLDGKDVETSGAGPLLSALSNFSIQSEGMSRVERGPRGEIIARESSDKNSVSVEVPSSFGLRLPLFLADDESVGIEVQVSLKINKDKQGVFTLSAPRAAEAQQKALVNLAGKLRGSLPGWLVALGVAESTSGVGAPVGV